MKRNVNETNSMKRTSMKCYPLKEMTGTKCTPDQMYGTKYTRRNVRGREDLPGELSALYLCWGALADHLILVLPFLPVGVDLS